MQAATARVPRFVPQTPIGILYAEDFAAPPPAARAVAAPEPPPLLTEADLARAREAGRAEGAEAARQEATVLDAELRRAALAAIGDALHAARDGWRAHAEAAAEALAATVLTALAAALPALCAQHAETELAALVQTVLPGLAREPAVEIRVHPDLCGPVAASLAGLAGSAGEPEVTVTGDTSLTPGDARLTWRQGRAERNARETCAAVCATLAEFFPPSMKDADDAG